MMQEQKKQKQRQFQQCYSQLSNKLQTYFTIKLIIFILVMVAISVLLNKLHSIKIQHPQVDQSFFRFTKIIQHQFSEIAILTFKVSKTIATILDKQSNNLQQAGQLHFLQNNSNFSFNLKKTIYSKYYGTTGQHTCLNGNCSSLNFYLQNLWSFKTHYDSLSVMYIQYLDPIQNKTELAIVPADASSLNETQVLNIFALMNSSLSYLIYKDELYITLSETYNISGLNIEPIRIIVKVNKATLQQTLNQFSSVFSTYSPFQISDNLNWLSLTQTRETNIFQYIEQTFSNSYAIKVYSKIQKKLVTLLIFNFQASIVYNYYQFLRIILLIPLLFLFIQFVLNYQILRKYFKVCFQPMQKLANLFEFNINQIFSGRRPNCSIILSKNSLSKFYQSISQIPASDFEPIYQTKKAQLKKQELKFIEPIKKIQNKYHQYTKDIFQQKNREIINNKFFIHSQVNQISQTQNKKIQLQYQRCKEIGVIQHFFKFSYLSLIRSPQQYDQIIETDASPLSIETINLFRSINRTISSHDIRKAFKLSSNVRKETEDELQMRIQIDLLQKYLLIFKDLDIHNENLQKLGFQRQIQNLTERIQNIKHILNKHNKNIRAYNK